MDVREVCIQAANEFAATRHASADLRLAPGERLPFEEDSFDAVMSFDVFEHVSVMCASLYRSSQAVLAVGLLLSFVGAAALGTWSMSLSRISRDR